MSADRHLYRVHISLPDDSLDGELVLAESEWDVKRSLDTYVQVDVIEENPEDYREDQALDLESGDYVEIEKLFFEEIERQRRTPGTDLYRVALENQGQIVMGLMVCPA